MSLASEVRKPSVRYRGLLEAAPDAIVVVNERREVVLVNLQTEKQFRYRRNELLGHKVDKIIPQGFAEWMLADGLRSQVEALEQQISSGIELRGRRKDGSEFPIEIMLSLLKSVEGVLVTAGIRDISVRKAAEKQLAQMERRYRGLLEAAPDAMVVVNQGEKIVLLNMQAEKYFGYRRDELLGQSITTIIPQGYAERLLADSHRSNQASLTQQIAGTIELSGRRKSGSEFPIEVMLSPLDSDEGRLVTAAIRDISDRKKLERMKDEFVATVSHELRTPLTSIAGALALLVGEAGGELPPAATRLLVIAHTNSERLVRLINDILDVEKLESGKVTFNLKRLDVQLLLEEVVEANRAFADGYGVHIRLADAPAACAVRADPDRLAQVVTNLISNAVKFSPKGADVVVAVETRGESVRISVRDHGCGIPDDFKPKVFQKFAQADDTNARAKGGTGLGLSIVQQITRRLGGTVSFDDAPGGGTVFNVDLPLLDSIANQEIDSVADAKDARLSSFEDVPDLERSRA
jgi:PAS domain S-box-containing protein